MSRTKAKGRPVVATAVQMPHGTIHDPFTKQLELGALTVVLHAFPDKLPRVEDGNELIRRQVAALRQFADDFESTLLLVVKGGVS